MTKQKTVILWGQNDLLTKAMEMFFRSVEKDTWKVIKFLENECISALVEQVQKSNPDLVILFQSMLDDASDPLMRLFEEQPELRVIADQPESRVITISLENNLIRFYSKHSIIVHQISDLLGIIEDSYFSNHPV